MRGLGAGTLPLAASMAKAYASDTGWTVTASALQVHGGIGFTWEHDLHFFLKRAKADGQLYGTARGTASESRSSPVWSAKPLPPERRHQRRQDALLLLLRRRGGARLRPRRLRHHVRHLAAAGELLDAMGQVHL